MPKRSILIFALAAIALGLFSWWLIVQTGGKGEAAPFSESKEWQRFLAKYQPDWQVAEDPVIKRPQRVFGRGISVSQILPEVKKISQENIAQVTEAFIKQNIPALQVDPATIKLTQQDIDFEGQLNQTGITIHNQSYQDLPVWGSKITTFYKGDDLVELKSDYYPDIKLDTTPSLTQEAVARAAKNHIETSARSEKTKIQTDTNGQISRQPPEEQILPLEQFILPESFQSISTSLVVYPKREMADYSYRLAWRLEFPPVPWDFSQGWTYLVDADNGEILQRSNYIRQIFGTVSGKVFPSSPPLQENRPFKNETINLLNNNQIISSTVTDKDGNYNIVGSGATELKSSLEGPYVKVLDYQTLYPGGGCSGIFCWYYWDPLVSNNYQSSYKSSSGIQENVFWQWNNKEASYKNEASNVFYHINTARDFFTKGDPFDTTVMDFPLPVLVNYYTSCNAFSLVAGGYTRLQFFSASSSCEATSLGADIIHHEYTHNVIDHLFIEGTGEVAPYWLLEMASIHEGLADYFAGVITNDSRMGENIFPANWTRDMENSKKLTSPGVFPEGHSWGEVFSGALWQIRKAIGQEYMDKLVFSAIKTAPTTFAEFVQNMLILDDNDANIFNGTPNGQQICQEFSTRGKEMEIGCAGLSENPIISIINPEDLGIIKNNILTLRAEIFAGFGSLIQSVNIYITGLNPARELLSLQPAIPVVGKSYILDTTLLTYSLGNNFPDGIYKIEAEVKDSSDRLARDSVTVFFDNISLPQLPGKWPFPGQWIPPQGSYRRDLVIDDLDKDGRKEVLAVGSTPGGSAAIFLWDDKGEIIPGSKWPVDLYGISDKIGDSVSQYSVSDIVVGDFLGDDSKEIALAFSGNNGSSRTQIVIFDKMGTVLSKIIPDLSSPTFLFFPYLLSKLAVGNFDDDKKDELIFNRVYQWSEPFLSETFVFNGDGSYSDGVWPLRREKDLLIMAVGDIDQDKKDELVGYERTRFGNTWNWTFAVFVVDNDGNFVSGWPKTIEQIAGYPEKLGEYYNDGPKLILTDIDGDRRLDLIGLYSGFKIGLESPKLNLFSYDFQSEQIKNTFNLIQDVIPGFITDKVIANFINGSEPEVLLSNVGYVKGLVQIRKISGELVRMWNSPFIGSNKTISFPEYARNFIVLENGEERLKIWGPMAVSEPGVSARAAFTVMVDGEGEFLPGWPEEIGDINFLYSEGVSGGTITDIDSDGDLELGVISGDGKIYMYDLPYANPRDKGVLWLQKHHDAQRTNRVVSEFTSAIDGQEAPVDFTGQLTITIMKKAGTAWQEVQKIINSEQIIVPKGKIISLKSLWDEKVNSSPGINKVFIPGTYRIVAQFENLADSWEFFVE